MEVTKGNGWLVRMDIPVDCCDKLLKGLVILGTSEAEPIWTEFLRKLSRRGLRGVKLVVSDAHEGIKAAVTKVLTATWAALPSGAVEEVGF